MSKAKSLLRTFCWFPGMDKAVENKVRECLPCQAVQPASNEQPIKPSELPSGPWQYVKMDFQGPYPNGDYIFIMIDRYSRWPEMVFFRNAPNASTTMAAMRSIFTDKGVPYVCQSDNGSPFQSEELKEFAKESGYYHHRVTPEWPRANGTVERFNRSMKEAVQSANIEGESLRSAAQNFIQMYRATLHTATGVSPHASMHGGREMRTVLPLITPTAHVVDRTQDLHYKAKMVNGQLPHTFCIGDMVIVKQKKVNKLTPAFNPVPLKITQIKGSTVTAQAIDGLWSITRDPSSFHKIHYDIRVDNDNEEDDVPNGYESVESGAHESPDSPAMGQSTPQNSQPVQLPRRSSRTIRKPDYLKDYIT